MTAAEIDAAPSVFMRNRCPQRRLLSLDVSSWKRFKNASRIRELRYAGQHMLASAAPYANEPLPREERASAVHSTSRHPAHDVLSTEHPRPGLA
jgi:hypothetical protein